MILRATLTLASCRTTTHTKCAALCPRVMPRLGAHDPLQLERHTDALGVAVGSLSGPVHSLSEIRHTARALKKESLDYVLTCIDSRLLNSSAAA